MQRRLLIGLLLTMAGVVAGVTWWLTHRHETARELALHGNVDLRQIALPFNNSERIADVLVQEGDRVRQGQVLARLDTRRLEPQVAQAEAQVAAQQQVVARLRRGSRPEEIAQAEAQVTAQQQIVARLRRGSRPEEIAQARANVESAQADAANARLQYERFKTLRERSAGGAISQQDVDNARAALDVAEARLVVAQKTLALAVAGPRQEEVAEAEARLRATEAQLALLRQALVDAQLVAPVDAVVRTRLLEPGEMASPQKPVFSLAITNPKWVRAYVSEPDLGQVHPGMAASVTVDSFPEQRFDGWVGFISPVAEFTPKTVQTEELRTSLVYEVRVFVQDPVDMLRLGMPATVYLPLEQRGPQTTEGQR
ncbi:MAG TPA: efflux RND transporter periplasmic adaptor subunit [Candidatus Tectomicrobia bacterium]|jgi:HlyD family secretion protein